MLCRRVQTETARAPGRCIIPKMEALALALLIISLIRACNRGLAGFTEIKYRAHFPGPSEGLGRKRLVEVQPG